MVAVLVGIVGYVSIQFIGLETWRYFAAAAGVTGAFGAVIAFRLGLTSNERQEVLDRLRRLGGVPAPAGPDEN